MVADGAQSLNQWWLATFPGLAIFSVVMAFNLAGDAVQDALDPRLRDEAVGPRPTSDYQHLLLPEEPRDEAPSEENGPDHTEPA